VTAGQGDRIPVSRAAVTVPPRPASRRAADAPLRATWFELLFFLAVGAAVFAGWRISDEEHAAADPGVQYALGIVGFVLLLLLLLYPLRKRVRLMHGWGAMKHWFRAHMILGVLVPAVIAFHSNFRSESLNSTVALAAMLLVVASGFVGRFLYSKIHYGLYGRRMTLAELKEGIEHNLSDSTLVLAYAPEVQRRLLAFDAAMLAPCSNVLQGWWRFSTIGLRARWMRVQLLRGVERAIRTAAPSEGWSATESRRRRQHARGYISAHLTTAQQVARFSLYERLFALWHLLHTPLFVMLLITVVVHILAVHLY